MPTPRKPTYLKLVTGTTRSHKRGAKPNTAEPKPRSGMGEPPAHMSPRGKQAWPYVAGILDRMGVLTEADGFALERLCECYADILAARASLNDPVEVLRPGALNADGLRGDPVFVVVAYGGATTYVTEGKSGPMLRTRPEVAIIADADRRFRAYLSDFGLTPAARTKVHMAGSEGVDELAEFFGEDA